MTFRLGKRSMGNSDAGPRTEPGMQFMIAFANRYAFDKDATVSQLPRSSIHKASEAPIPLAGQPVAMTLARRPTAENAILRSTHWICYWSSWLLQPVCKTASVQNHCSGCFINDFRKLSLPGLMAATAAP